MPALALESGLPAKDSMMLHLTNEILAAYADGELSPQMAGWVEAELERNPEAQRRLAAFQAISRLVVKAHALGPCEEEVVQAAPMPWRRQARFARTGLAFACMAGLLWAVGGVVGSGTGVSRPGAPVQVAGQTTAAGHATAAPTAAPLESSGDVVLAAWLRGVHAAPYR